MTLRYTDTRLLFQSMLDGNRQAVTDIVAFSTSSGINLYGVTPGATDGLVWMQATFGGDLTYVENVGARNDNPDRYFQAVDAGNPEGMTIAFLEGVPHVLAAGDTIDTSLGDVPKGLSGFAIAPDGTPTFEGTFPSETDAVTDPSFIGDKSSPLNVFEIEDRGGAGDILFVGNMVDFDFYLPDGWKTNSTVAADVNVVGMVTRLNNPDRSTPYVFFLEDSTNEIRYINFPKAETPYINTLSDTKTSDARAPSDLEFVNVGKSSILISADEQAGINVYSIKDKRDERASVIKTDHIEGLNKDGGTDIIDAFKIGDRAFLATFDDKIIIYEIDDDGTLFKMDDLKWGGRGIHDVEVVSHDGIATIFVSASNDADFSRGPGIDTLQFTPGNARDLSGSRLADVLKGDTRDNTIEGKASGDRLFGASGRDALYGQGGNDRLFGGRDGDSLFGGGGNDILEGGSSFDVLFGDRGRDRLYGEQGADNLFGGASSDVLYGGSGGDELSGGGGSDRLYDGSGTDTLVGGGGVDTFVLTNDRTYDRISLWERRDKIDLRDHSPNLEFSDLTIRETGDGDVIIGIGRDQLELDAQFYISAASIRPDDFIFG